MFSSVMKGPSISWRTLIASRLEAVRPEMSPSMWVIACALGCQLVLIPPSSLLNCFPCGLQTTSSYTKIAQPAPIIAYGQIPLIILYIYMYVCIYIYQRRQWHPTPVLLLGKSHGRRSLVGCSPWGCEESDMTERLHFHFSLSCIGEGNATHSSVLAWRIPGTGEPGGLPSMGSHRVRYDWSDLAAAAYIYTHLLVVLFLCWTMNSMSYWVI